jgi:hypothetical protein
MKTSGGSPLTAADVLQTGHWFSHAAEQFEIMARDSQRPLEVEVPSANTGTVRQFTLLELFDSRPVTHFATTRKVLENETEKSGSSVAEMATLSERLMQRADHIIQTVDAVQVQIV